jgi:hypothetical protein
MERKNTYQTSTGQRIRYAGRFRYLVVSRYFDTVYEPDPESTSFDRSAWKPLYNEDGSRARSDWDKIKRTDSEIVVEATVRAQRLAGRADIEVIDTQTGEIVYEHHREDPR